MAEYLPTVRLTPRYFDYVPWFGSLRLRNTSILAFVMGATAATALAAWALTSWGLDSLVRRQEWSLTNSVRVEGLRVAPDGSVLGYTRETPQFVDVWRWSANNAEPRTNTLFRIAWHRLSLGNSGTSPSVGALGVLPDLVDSRATWFANGTFNEVSTRSGTDSYTVGNFFGSSPEDWRLFGQTNAVFRNSTGIWQVNVRGESSVFRLSERSCDAAVGGSYMALSCPDGRIETWIGSTNGVSQLERRVSSVGTGVCVTDDGAAGVGTQRNTAELFDRNLVVSTEVTAPALVRQLACDGDFALAAGEFPGVFLLRPNSDPVQVAEPGLREVRILSIGTLSATGGTFVVAPTQSSSITGGTPLDATLSSFRVYPFLNLLGGGIAVAWCALATYGLLLPWLRYRAETRRMRTVSDGHESERRLRPSVAGRREADELPPPPLPPALVRACATGDCVAFVGAGIGAHAGFPTWRPLIDALLREAIEAGTIDSAKSESLRNAFDEGQTDLTADGLVSALSPRAIHQFLARTFLEPGLRTTPIHERLRGLNLSAILTSNFDPLLDQTFADRSPRAYTHLDAEPLLSALNRRDFFLLRLYGALDRPDSVLLSPTQYYEAMARNTLFSRFMEALFASRTLLFIGASLDGIDQYLNGIRFPTAMPQRHFALVAVTGGAWRAKADLLARRYGIEVIPYTPSDGYPELGAFLDSLGAAVAAHAGRDAKPKAVSTLRKVHLDNIGPFTKLEVEVDPNWTILLGDNGVGKSTILRAIAVGIIGPDAAPYAGRLIKAGETLGTITLETSQNRKYVTQIHKGDQHAIVESFPQARALEAEQWLALGFPALRTFTWSAVKESAARGATRATSDDLLPLISGDLDPRLETLKSWFIDIDYQDASTERATARARRPFFSRPSTSDGAPRARRDEFFEVINRLTPGMDIEPLPIDAVKKEVLVRMNGRKEPIRIESVSQGTQSLLGWVGILLQRLHDFYGSGESLEQTAPDSSLLKQAAIVLMDEIDAHMHPRWQQTIVGTLKQLFPNCQFIATTHSPLIVVGMERQEVMVVRTRDGADVEAPPIVERPTHSLRGWGAHQVLTDRLFGLETVLDPTIHEDVERYTELAAIDNREPDQDAELERLAIRLDVERPAPKQRDEARKAFEMLEKALDAQLASLPGDEQLRIKNEAKVQIEENITGSRRPG